VLLVVRAEMDKGKVGELGTGLAKSHPCFVGTPAMLGGRLTGTELTKSARDEDPQANWRMGPCGRGTGAENVTAQRGCQTGPASQLRNDAGRTRTRGTSRFIPGSNVVDHGPRSLNSFSFFLSLFLFSVFRNSTLNLNYVEFVLIFECIFWSNHYGFNLLIYIFTLYFMEFLSPFFSFLCYFPTCKYSK
jgi:hypothetical protein